MTLKNKIRIYRILAVLCWSILTVVSLLLLIALTFAASILGGIVAGLFFIFAALPIWNIENKIDELKKQQEQENAPYILADKYRW